MGTTLAPIDPAYQDVDSRGPTRRRTLLVLYLLAGLAYFAWRLTVFNPDALAFSTIFYLAELGGFLGSLLLFFVIYSRRRRATRSPPRGVSVDIFVPTYNEEIDVVRRALVAARRVRYPHETWLLDDGNRPSFRAMAKELGCRYLPREDNRGAKAGNLNNGLAHASGDFVAILDADHCAQPDFLDRLLGYFDDSEVCIVQTPQDYYNLNSFQHGRDRRSRLIWNDQSGFHHAEQPGRDRFESATLCGCSCILRRSHLDLIGGFPPETVTEDMHAAVKMQKLGLKTIYHDEPLAFGIAPPDLIGFVRQRLRWGEGNMQVSRIERLPFTARLSPSQNLSYLLLAYAYLDAWRKLIFYISPIVTLLTDVPPIYGEAVTFLLLFFPYFAFGVLTYDELYAGFGRLLKTEAYVMARLTAGLLATWGLFRSNIRFRVSSKRLVGRLPVGLVGPQLLILVGGIVAIGVAGLKEIEIMMDLRFPGGVPTGIAAILMGLTAYHCFLAGDVLRETWRSAAIREESYWHDVQLPVRLRAADEVDVAWTDLVSTDAAVLKSDLLPLTDREFAAEIYLPSGVVAVPARLTANGREGRHLEFLWPNLAARDELDQALHAGRWHRVVTGRYEVTLSPFERFGLLAPPVTRRPEARGPWEPVLVTQTGTGGHRDRLGYLRRADPSLEYDELLLFGPPADVVEVTATRRAELLGRRFRLGDLPETPLLDESALDCVGGRRRTAAVAADVGLPGNTSTSTEKLSARAV